MKIVFFDGYCSLCNGLVDWLMRVDKKKQLKFASLQGETAKRILTDHSLKLNDPDTIIFVRDKEIFDRSTAILHIFNELGGVWNLFRICFIVPKFLRDFFYMMVARNRYLFFKRSKTCRVPTIEERDRLLD